MQGIYKHVPWKPKVCKVCRFAAILYKKIVNTQ